jgi:pimeloyl-ACP methyl ester carboxylesterase
VLLHGLGTTQQIWSLVVSALAADRRVITVDLPGFGGSAPAGAGFDFDEVGARLARGLAARRVRVPFDLVGHSLGGAVALSLAAKRPRLVRRLVLVAPAGLQPRSRVPPILLGPGAERVFELRRRLAPLTDLRWGRRLLLAFTAENGAALSSVQARMMVQASAGASRISPAMTAIARSDLRPLLRRTTVPLGLIWGARDRAVPAGLAQEIRSVRPDATLELIEGTGHVPMIERPAQFAAALERLLATLDRDATTSGARARRLP